eukprot:403347399
MGGKNSTEQQPPGDQNSNTWAHTTEQKKLTAEEMQRVREQRAKALQQRIEDQRREDQLKNQEVINFKNIHEQQSPEQQKLPSPNKVNQEQTKPITQPNLQQQQQQKLPQPKEEIKVQHSQQTTGQQNLQASALLDRIKSQQKVEEQKPQNQSETQIKPQPQPQKQVITKESRVHQFISDVFQITNDNSSATNKNKTFLYEFCGEGRLFSLDNLDDILMSRLQKQKDENKFVYLYQTYRKIENHLYVKEKIIEPAQVSDVKEQIVSFFNTCLILPETFNLKNETIQQPDNDGQGMGGQDMNQMLMQMLQGGGQGMPPGGLMATEKLQSWQIFNFSQMQNNLWEAFEKESIAADQEFMEQLLSVMRESGDDYQIKLFFDTLFQKMHLNLNSIKIEKFRVAESQLEMIKLLFTYKEAQEAFVNNPLFFRQGHNGKTIQGIAKSQQSGISRMTDQVAEQLNNLHKQIYEVIQKLLKNKECKDKVVSWLRHSISLNMEKQKMYTQIPVASDGFILNLMSLLLLFCKPFTSKFAEYHSHFQKINCFYLIDDRFFIGGSKIEKLNQDTVNQFIQNLSINPQFTGLTQEPNQKSSLEDDIQEMNQSSGNTAINENYTLTQPNFITEVFFLAHQAVHMMEKKLEQQYEQLGKSINKAAKERDFNLYEEFMGQKLSIDAHLIGKNTLACFRSLFTFSGALFQSMSSGVSPYQLQDKKVFEDIQNFQQMVLMLRQKLIENGGSGFNTPLDIAVLPIHILTNLATLPRLFRQIEPESYYGKDVDLHIQVATNVHAIVSPYLKNPHTKAEMIKFLAYLVPQSILHKDKESNPQQNQKREREDNLYKDIFFLNITLRELLIESIVHVYIDAERTGYYEKASFRFFARKERPGLFIEFCNFLINDMNNLLFEGLLELEEIRDYEELQSSGELMSLDQELRESMEAKYQENSRKAKAHFQLSNMVVKLLQKVTINVQEPFVSEELGERYANALNFCIDSLVSQKDLKLKVNNPDQYNFEPRALLINILMMYANMSEQESFLRHVVNDTRSYKDETFDKALRLLNNPKKGVQIDQERTFKFEVMVSRLKSLRNEINEEEGMYDDAPEDLLDPIMNTLMKEPVELPASNTIIDFITIKKHLMNDPNDPFNRSPLTLEQLIPRPDIKKRIEEYKLQKKEQKQSQ